MDSTPEVRVGTRVIRRGENHPGSADCRPCHDDRTCSLQVEVVHRRAPVPAPALVAHARARRARSGRLVPDAATQAIFDTGTPVGEYARGPPGARRHADRSSLRRLSRRNSRPRNVALGTRTHAGDLRSLQVPADGVFVAVDILERDGRGWRVVEVKSSTSVKPAAPARRRHPVHALRAARLAITGAEVMVLNSAIPLSRPLELFRREGRQRRGRGIAAPARRSRPR